MTTRGIASHRPAPVPIHVRSVASELDLSDALVRTLRRFHSGETFSITLNVLGALVRRGLFEHGALTDAGRAACARLFPGPATMSELADMPDWDSPAQPDHLADTVAEVES